MRARLSRPRARAAAGAARALRGGGRCVVEEARADPAAVADRARARAHHDAPVGGRAEVVDEHPAVDDRLAARPADLGEQLRNRLGQDDVAAEVGQPAADRAPAGRPGVRGDDDLRRAQPAARGGDDRPGESTSPACARGGRRPRRAPPGAAHGRAAQAGRSRVGNSTPRRNTRRHRRARRDRPLGYPQLGGDPDRLLHRLVLRRRGRHLEHPAAAQPDVLAELLDGRRARPPTRGRGRARARRRAASGARQRAPVGLEKAAVPPARPVADVLGLEHDDPERGVAPPQRQRGPEPRVAAADDGDVGLGVARERRRLGIGRRLVQPPRHAAQHAIASPTWPSARSGTR